MSCSTTTRGIVANIRRPAKKVCYIKACGNKASVWIVRREFANVNDAAKNIGTTVEAKVCAGCALGQPKADNQNG